MSFECLYNTQISENAGSGLTKFLSIDRRSGAGAPFLQFRLFRLTPEGYKATNDGISLSQHQTNLLIDLINTKLKLSEAFLDGNHLSPPGVYNLSFQYGNTIENSWIILNREGKQLLVLRKKHEQDSISGLALNIDEYMVLKENVNVIQLIMAPQAFPKDVEIMQALAYEICSLIRELTVEFCLDCMSNAGNTIGHTCAMPDLDSNVDMHFVEACNRIDLAHVLKNITFLRSALKLGTPVPTGEQVREYMQSPDWYYSVAKTEKNPFHALITSFLNRTRDE